MVAVISRLSEGSPRALVGLTGLILVMGLVGLMGGTAQAAPPPVFFHVNSTADDIDDNIGNGVCHTAANECTLRAAIQEAENGVQVGVPVVIEFSIPADGGSGPSCSVAPNICTITLTVALPTLTDSIAGAIKLKIDGASQAVNQPGNCTRTATAIGLTPCIDRKSVV